MEKIVQTLSTRRNLLIILFVIFLFLRLFVSNSSILLTSDSLKFMHVAKNFPYHTLYNNQLYLLHPPVYPYTIYFLTLIFQEDYLAATILSLVSSVITFFLLYKFFMMLTNNFNLTFVTLIFYTLSVGFVNVSHSILREPYAIMILLFALYFYVKGLKFGNKKHFIIASILGAILAIISDYVVLLLPALVLSYIIFNTKKINIKKFIFPNIKYAILPIIVILLIYGSWLNVRAYQYINYEYYPNGYSGTPISTEDLGILQLISPQNFEDYDAALPSFPFDGIVPTIKRLVFNAGYIFNIQPLSIPEGLNFTTMGYLLKPHHIVYMFVIYLPLTLATLYGFLYVIKRFIKTKQIYNNTGLYILGLFLIFAFPITQKYAGPRYIYIAYIFFFYFISLGILLLINKIGKLNPDKFITGVVIFLLFLVIPVWYINHDNFILFNDVVYSAQNTADYIKNNIPEDAGIMTQPGYTIKLIYSTGNRIVAIYPKPEALFNLIDYYNISYIVVGRYYTYDAHHLAQDSVEYVQSNPDKFELVVKIDEDYTEFFTEEDPISTDEVYIYKVKN